MMGQQATFENIFYVYAKRGGVDTELPFLKFCENWYTKKGVLREKTKKLP